MSSPDNFEYFTHEIEKTHDMTQQETDRVEHINGIYKKKPERPMPKSQTLAEKIVESNDQEKKLQEYQKFHALVRQTHEGLNREKKGPCMHTNYNRKYNPKTGCHRLVKTKSDCDFDKKYYEREQLKNHGLTKLEEEKMNQEQEICTFAPKIDENSSKIAKEQIGLKPLSIRYQQELRARQDKILEMKKHFIDEKEAEEDRLMGKDDKHPKYRFSKKDVFESSHFWYENKEKKVFEAKLQAYEQVTEGCNFEPKQNSNFNNTLELGDFLDRQTNHLKRVENKKGETLHKIEPYSFIPKLNPKSLKMAKNKKLGVQAHTCYDQENQQPLNYATRPANDTQNLILGLSEKDTTMRKKKRNPEAFERLTRPVSKRPALGVVNLPKGKNPDLYNLNDTEGLPAEYQEYLKHQDKISSVDFVSVDPQNINVVEVQHVPEYLSAKK